MNALNLGNGGHWQKCKRGNESRRTGMRNLRNKTVLLFSYIKSLSTFGLQKMIHEW